MGLIGVRSARILAGRVNRFDRAGHSIFGHWSRVKGLTGYGLSQGTARTLDEHSSSCFLDSLSKIGDGEIQALAQGNHRIPSEHFPSARNVWLTLLRIILRKSAILDSCIGPAGSRDFVSEFADCELAWVAEIYGFMETVGIHQSDQTVYQVVHVTKRTGLLSAAVNREFIPAQGLDHEV